MQKKVEQLNPDLTRNPSSISLSVYESGDENEVNVQYLDKENTEESPMKYASDRGRMEMVSDDGKSDNNNNPLLFGSFTNWKPKKMMRLEDFIMILAKKYGRQNQEMYEDFSEILAQMRK